MLAYNTHIMQIDVDLLTQEVALTCFEQRAMKVLKEGVLL